MKKQTIQFATVTDKNSVVSKVGKSIITQPKTNFKGGSVKWYPDKLKSEKGTDFSSSQLLKGDKGK